MKVVDKVLKEFYDSLRQRMNKLKMKFWFSKNVDHTTRKRLSGSLGVNSTENLGKYLGVPLLHSRVTKQTYQFLIDRIQQKLVNWPSSKLSLAGRVTLAQSVLSTILTYCMQTSFLPRSTCDEIDRICRNFIWGFDETH